MNDKLKINNCRYFRKVLTAQITYSNISSYFKRKKPKPFEKKYFYNRRILKRDSALEHNVAVILSVRNIRNASKLTVHLIIVLASMHTNIRFCLFLCRIEHFKRQTKDKLQEILVTFYDNRII